MKEIVLSGVRSTGKIHLGNYFGAIQNFVKMQETHNAFFFIADYHALTTHPKSTELQHLVKETLATYLACGLDPEKCTLYVQSDVPQIPELYLLLNMIAYKGELEKVPTFKEKIRAKNQSINAGLLTYPVLMAADIIIHRATKVPVGKDQQQHLEMARNLAVRFNHTFGEDIFPEPQAFNFTGELVKILSLDGSGAKMSKSDNNPNNAIYLSDSDDLILKKIKKAKSDAGPTEPNSPISEDVAHLFSLMDLVSAPDVIEKYKQDYANCDIKYGYMKLQLAEDLTKVVAPIREKIIELLKDETYLAKVVKKGAENARANAEKTMKEVRRVAGINYF